MYRYGSDHYRAATWRKVTVVEKIVDWGFNVLHSDVDVVWFRWGGRSWDGEGWESNLPKAQREAHVLDGFPPPWDLFLPTRPSAPTLFPTPRDPLPYFLGEPCKNVDVAVSTGVGVHIIAMRISHLPHIFVS